MDVNVKSGLSPDVPATNYNTTHASNGTTDVALKAAVTGSSIVVESISVINADAAAEMVGAHIGFEAKPSEMYPAMIAHIKELLASGKGPAKYLDLEGSQNPLIMYWDEAKKIGAGGMDLALVPYSQAVSMDDVGKKLRNAALECARKWFTELLHQSIGNKAMGLRILAEDRAFKLV